MDNYDKMIKLLSENNNLLKSLISGGGGGIVGESNSLYLPHSMIFGIDDGEVVYVDASHVYVSNLQYSNTFYELLGSSDAGITLSGCQLRVFTANNEIITYTDGVDGINVFLDPANHLYTVTGKDRDFVVTDKFIVTVFTKKQAYDIEVNAVKTISLSEPQYQNTDPILHYDSIFCQTDDTLMDVGNDINCRNYHKLGLWVDFTANDSLNNKLYVYAKDTETGDIYELEVESDFVKIFPDGSTFKKFFQFDVTNIPVIAIKAKSGTVGSNHADIKLSYSLDY